MKGIFKIILSLVIIALLIIIGALIWTNYFAEPEMPNLKQEMVEYKKINNYEEETESYLIKSSKIDADDFINLSVNSFVDEKIVEFKKDNSSQSKILPRDKAVFKNVIDTFIVNENIVSVKVTIMQKGIEKENYDTQIQTYNFYLKDKVNISLDDLFKAGYKEKIKDKYTDKYLLKNNSIEFYNNTQKNNCTYNTLKEYGKNKIITAKNYDISQEEYDKLLSRVVDPSRKMVAITLDDGPHGSNTQKILDILDAHSARATFFMLGQNVVNNEGVVKDVYSRGNEIGIHTWSHPQLTNLSESSIKSQIEQTSDAIYNVTGYRPTLVRPPYGSFNKVVKDTLKDYSLILWNIDSLDWKSRDENQIVPLVMNDIQDGDIILLHDIHSTTVPAVDKIVSELDKQGYQMVTVSELIEAKGYNRETTQVFYSGRQ